ncbi:MAG: histidine kinase, partial [Spirochaetae bacterium HGW-Spirochaetae-7]
MKALGSRRHSIRRWNSMFFFCISLLAAIPVLAQGTGTRTVAVGGDWADPPFTYLDEGGKPAGFTVDLVRRIAETAGLNVTFELTSRAEAKAKLERGGVDMLAG